MSVADRYPLAFRLYPYRADQPRGGHTPVVVVGAGPIGLTVALDLGLNGHRVVVLDDHEGVGMGSRAICFSKRTLEIMHRLGAGEQMLEAGVVWQKGRVFRDRDEIYAFDLLPEDGHRFPAFINLSQIHFEKFLYERLEEAVAQGAQIEVRGKNRVDALEAHTKGAKLTIMTPDGPYEMEADWVIACDGAKSPIRDMMGLGFEGRVFEDNFLIADVKMTADFPTERWFWFEPWFKSGASALLHKQPNDIWRIDFQLGWDIDREKELKPENIRARVDAMLGPDVAYELDWCSIYTFQCRRMARFAHGRVLFAGDAAHQVSPFGARGANSGVQDAENLAWRLDLILKGQADERVMEGYNAERVTAADENILNSTRSTDFLTPKSPASKCLRDAVLTLAEKHPFARPLVNSGRLSVPCVYDELAGFTEDATRAPARSRPGAPCPDAPVGRSGAFLLDEIGEGFMLLGLGVAVPDQSEDDGLPVCGRTVVAKDIGPALAQRFLGEETQMVYLLRPDQHVVARWTEYDPKAISAALKRALEI